MGNQIYSKEGIVIFRAGDEFIVHNTHKKFEEGHTHLKNFKASKAAINHVIRGTIPRCGKYYLESLKRLSTDENYRRRIDEIMQAKETKSKQKYININKGVVR